MVKQRELFPLNVSSVVEFMVVGTWLGHALTHTSVH